MDQPSTYASPAFDAPDHASRCAAVVAAAADAIIGVDADLRICVFNPAAERMFGRPAEELLGTELSPLFAEDSRGTVRALLDGGTVSEVQLAQGSRQGEAFPLELTVVRAAAPGLRWVLTLRDPGDRFDVEVEYARLVRALDEERARVESVVDAAPIGIIVYDASGHLMFNARAQQLLGIDLRGGPVAYCSVMRHPDGTPLTPDELPSQRALHGETVRSVELRVEPPGGERRRILGSAVPVRGPGGRIFGAVSVFDDVTALHRREQEQRFLGRAGEVLAGSFDDKGTLEQIVQLVVPELADGCVACVAEDDRLVPAAWASRDPACARRLDELYAGGPGVAVERLGERVGAETSLTVPLTARGRTVGAITLIGLPGGKALGAAERPLVTEFAHRAALAVDNARLLEDERRARCARDEVLAVVAHDLRNPLHAVQMMSSLLAQNIADPQTVRRLQSIQRAATRMNRLIQDLLDISKLESGTLGLERAPLRPEQLVAEAVDAARLTVENRRLDAEVGESLPRIDADRDRLLQVLSNLIGNAVKFTGPDGVIRVSAHAVADEVVFAVSDDGAGIPPDQLPHVFDRFYQGRRSDRRGAGLGLAICKGLVEAHGGRMWVESELGQGTTVCFAVPRAAF